MPPKQQGKSKADLAKKQKVVEDKTFGLKNKNKSKNVQKYVQNLQQSVQPKADPSKVAAKKKKEEEKAREKELNDLFKIAVTQPKVPPGVDPKSIVCEFFKAGQCTKGFKCKFSHDLNVQRKGEKIDIYSDKRDQETMEDWDQETLEKVVESKKTEYNQNKPTEIVCKHFLEAVEKKQYGWFWVCPNGGKDCHYRHALPPGYVLKSQMKALLEEESEKITIEEEIENQRSKTTSSTPMTTELFMQWKTKKMEEREVSLAAQRADRAKNDRMSGRELFLSDASLFVDDAEAYEAYHREEPEDTEQKGKDDTTAAGPSGTASAAADSEDILLDDDDDDDELNMDELNELEASLSRTSIQIQEPEQKMDSMRFLYSKGVLSCSSDAPPITTFLESLPGSYTTTRTHENGTTLLFWERHLKRLSNSTRILLNSNPELIFKTNKKSPLLFSPFPVTALKWESRIRSLVSNSLSQVLPIALKERSKGEELAVTALVSGDIEKLKAMKNVGGGGDDDDDKGVFQVLDLHLHIGSYIPPVFGIEESGAHLALVGHGRDLADAKYSDWVRLRKPLEKLRPPSVTELLLSNDGDRILEGCITNFFVICQRDKSEAEGKYLDGYNNVYSVEVQTAPVSDGVLPGVIRQLVIEVCHSKGIPVCEVAPSWEKHRLWEEAFVTNSLRVLQHVETIKVPQPWESLKSKCFEGISWIEKKFEGPGIITKVIQKEIMERASTESHPLNESI